MSRKGCGQDRKGRFKEEQFITLPHSKVRSDAFRALSGAAVKVYLELHSRFWGGINGKLSLSLEEGAPLLGLGKSTVRRALIELEEIGGKLPSVAIPSREASQMGHAGLKEVARQWQLIVPQTSVRDPHMRILMLCANGLPQPDAPRGGPIYYWQNLQALVQLGHEVHLRIIAPASPVPTEILSKLASCAFIPLKKSHSISHKIKMISPKFRRINHLAPNYVTIWEDIRRQYDAVQPEMIWADWIGSLVASYEVDQVPIVYALHDFAFRIEQVKRKTNPLRVSSRARASIKSFRDMEFEIIRKASAIASASAIESEIVQRNTGVISEYIPIVGDYVNKSFGDKIGINCKYFIFGNTNTAMKASRIDLKQNILSSKQMRRMDWHHVGRIPQSERKKWSDAVSGSDMNFHGYVKDLGDVFDPGDALVTPYPEGTGFRTKFVTAAAYGVVNIAYETNYECAPEFVPGENCLSAPDAPSLVDALKHYGADVKIRQRLSDAARNLYESSFLLEHQMAKYERVIETAITRVVSPHRVVQSDC